MPAKSKSQQRFMGMVYQCKKTGKCASPEIKKAAKSIKQDDAEKYAKTKRKGLPEKVTESTPTFVQFLEQEEKQIKISPKNVGEIYRKYVGDILSRLNAGNPKEAEAIYNSGPKGYVFSPSDITLLKGKAAIDSKMREVIKEMKLLLRPLKKNIKENYTPEQIQKRNTLRYRRIMDRGFTGSALQDQDVIRLSHQFIMDETVPMTAKIEVMTKRKSADGNAEKATVEEIKKYVEDNS